jgi:alkanesulfonate monooxygenase SsuD/methylene tetrahydromethanopterin reductase-like flavin-dependent oxidoreductase (luciferase family)
LTGFLAGVTETIDLSPAVMLVTLRHPVLVAKQLAELQLLSGNRLRVAASVGWNKEELRGLRVEPSTRGARLDEALPLIRHLLTEESVTHTGEHYRIDQLGIHPRPTTPPEIWVGGGNFDTMGSPGERAMRRVARLADGFKLMAPTGRDVDNALRLAERLHEHAAEAGRTLSIEARLLTQVTAPEDWAGVVRRYRESGLITQLGLGNRIVGGPVAEQLALLENVAACTRSEWQ